MRLKASVIFLLYLSIRQLCWVKGEGRNIFSEKYFYLIEVQDSAGRPDRVEDSVVDDGVYGERDAVRGEDVLGRNLEDLSPGVDPLNLLQEREDEYEPGTSDDGLKWDLQCNGDCEH